MKNNIQKIPFLVAVTLLLASSFAFLFLYMQINKNNDRAEADLNKWEAEVARREEIKSLDRTLKNVQEEKAELEKHFAQSSDVVPFLNTIESLARAVGTDPEIMSVESSKESDILLVGMQTRGSFEAVYKFLMLLENSPYQVELTSVNVSRSVGEGSRPWDMMLKFKLLSFIK